MDFRMGEGAEEFRADLRAFLEQAVTDERAEEYYRTGVLADREFVAEALEAGYVAVPPPPGDWGAPQFEPWQARILDEEFLRAEAPCYGYGTSVAVARSVVAFGSPALIEEFVGPTVRGELITGYGFSEPESGSDVAAAKTRAVRDGDEWVINGSKMFTTNAHVADYIFLLARTNPDVPKHAGLTLFLVPVKDAPGFTAQAVYTVSGERTNITFYDDMRISDHYRIGEIDGGWKVMLHALQDEHSAAFVGQGDRMVCAAEDWAREAGRTEDEDALGRLGKAAAEVEVGYLLQRRAAWMDWSGKGIPVAEGPMAKLHSSETLERASQDLVDLMGPDGLRSFYEPTAPQNGGIEHMLRFSLGTTIYAGASEVQRNIIAGQGLGLPRS